MSITQSDGTEVDQVLCVQDRDKAEVDHIEAEISALLAGTKTLGVAAASKALWKALRRLNGGEVTIFRVLVDMMIS